ncbi:programmed cell death 1 ligand 1-like [Pelmatolapia mariae]|uniref:programmed cell death 1 ligand 1-like n=1 Tax=Pelmatolapia mariae TaxID=158779 RepID=UPI002FE51BE4
MCRRTSFLFFSTFLFVDLFVFVSADQKNITATPGQKNVTLPCRAPNNNIIVVLEWSRADLGEKYVLLFRDEQLDPEQQHPSFKNRVELLDRQMKNGDVSLILKNVTSTDNGTYECRVIQGGTKRRKRRVLDGDPISSINLSVVDPPGQTGGDTEDGGKEAGGKEAGGKEAGGVVLIAGLSVSVVLLVAVVGFLIYRKHKQQQSQDSYQPPVEFQPV